MRNSLVLTSLQRSLIYWLANHRFIQNLQGSCQTLLLRTLEELAFLAYALGNKSVQKTISAALCNMCPKLTHPRHMAAPAQLRQLQQKGAPCDVYSLACAMSDQAAMEYLIRVQLEFQHLSRGNVSSHNPYYACMLITHFPRREFMSQQNNSAYIVIRSDYHFPDGNFEGAHRALLIVQLKMLGFKFSAAYVAQRMNQVFRFVEQSGDSQMPRFAFEFAMFTSFLFSSRYHEVEVDGSVSVYSRGTILQWEHYPMAPQSARKSFSKLPSVTYLERSLGLQSWASTKPMRPQTYSTRCKKYSMILAPQRKSDGPLPSIFVCATHRVMAACPKRISHESP